MIDQVLLSIPAAEQLQFSIYKDRLESRSDSLCVFVDLADFCVISSIVVVVRVDRKFKNTNATDILCERYLKRISIGCHPNIGMDSNGNTAEIEIIKRY